MLSAGDETTHVNERLKEHLKYSSYGEIKSKRLLGYLKVPPAWLSTSFWGGGGVGVVVEKKGNFSRQSVCLIDSGWYIYINTFPSLGEYAAAAQPFNTHTPQVVGLVNTTSVRHWRLKCI